MPPPRIGTLRTCLPHLERNFRNTEGVEQIGLGEKEVSGTRTGRTAVVFFVRRKTANPSRKIPERIDLSTFDGTLPRGTWIETDVVECTSQEDLLAMDGGDILLSDVALGTGTLGIVLDTKDASGRVWGITNAHVVARVDADARGKSVISNSFVTDRTIGHVHSHSRLKSGRSNSVDLALLDLDESLRNKPLVTQGVARKLSGFRSLSETVQGGSRRIFGYHSNGQKVLCQTPKRIARGQIRHPGGRHLAFASYCRLDLSPGTPDRPAPGHSGSLLVTEINGKSYAAGLVFGGSARSVIAYDWATVRTHLRSWVAGIRS